MKTIKIQCPKCPESMTAPSALGSCVAICPAGHRRTVLISANASGELFAKFKPGRTPSGYKMIGAAVKVYPHQAEHLAEYGMTAHTFLQAQYAEWVKSHPKKLDFFA